MVEPATNVAVARMLATNRNRISSRPFQGSVTSSAVDDSTVTNMYACDRMSVIKY